MASGGYRRPAHPSPVSGPGALSKRTDGGPGAQTQAVPTGLPYGDHQTLVNQERTAPMSASATGPAPLALPTGGGGGGAPVQLPPFGESQRPDEPITAGLDIGPGPGSEVLPVQHQPQYQAQGPMVRMLAPLAARDMTGALADVYASAQKLNV